MDKEKFIQWVNDRKNFYSEIWCGMIIEDNKEMLKYINGKVSILDKILDLTKRGDFDE